MKTMEWLSWVSAAIRHSGWVSLTEAKKSTAPATSDVALVAYQIWASHSFLSGGPIYPNDADVALAEYTLNWYRTRGGDWVKGQPYYGKLMNILAKDELQRSHYATAAMAFREMYKCLVREETIKKSPRPARGEEVKANPEGQFVGRIGSRISTGGIVQSLEMDVEVGRPTKTYVQIDNGEGKLFVFQSLKPEFAKLSPSDIISVEARISAHVVILAEKMTELDQVELTGVTPA